MKVTCKVIQDLLPLYVDGVCSPDTAALVEEHLKDCEACQEAYHALKEAPAPTPGDGADKDAAVAKGLKKVKSGLRRKRYSRRSTTVRSLSIRCAIILMR